MLFWSHFLDQQQALETRYRRFISILDRNRTITLCGMLQPALVVPHLSWFRADRFQQCLQAMVEWFGNLPDHSALRRELPLFFVQKTDPVEDIHEQEQLSANGDYWKMRFGSVPAAAFYLHTRSKFLWSLDGHWRTGLKIIPLKHYSSSNNYRWRPRPLIIGMRIIDYAEVLEISSEVATDYFARMVIHDYGHSYLPVVEREQEALHNAVMIQAMAVAQPASYATAWEELVHQECTNPFFFLEADALIAACESLVLNPVQTVLLSDYKRFYQSKKRSKQWQEWWSIQPGTSKATAQDIVRDKIEELQQTGFAAYSQTATR